MSARPGGPALLVVIAAALLAAAAPSDAAVRLLGGAIASEVRDDEATGLHDVLGIQGAAWSVTVPYSAQLVLYLHWEGDGPHDVTVIVRAPSGATVDGFEETLDFGPGTSSWSAHDLSTAVFRDAGVYAVEVDVDGARALVLPWCVNAAPPPGDDPLFLLSTPAADGGLDGRGRGSIEGVFQSLAFRRFPGVEGFAIVTAWFSGNGFHSHQVLLRDPSGAVAAWSKAQDVVARPGAVVVVTDYFDDFIFRAAGSWTVTVFLDDAERASWSLPVSIVPEGARP